MIKCKVFIGRHPEKLEEAFNEWSANHKGNIEEIRTNEYQNGVVGWAVFFVQDDAVGAVDETDNKEVAEAIERTDEVIVEETEEANDG